MFDDRAAQPPGSSVWTIYVSIAISGLIAMPLRPRCSTTTCDGELCGSSGALSAPAGFGLERSRPSSTALTSLVAHALSPPTANLGPRMPTDSLAWRPRPLAGTACTWRAPVGATLKWPTARAVETSGQPDAAHGCVYGMRETGVDDDVMGTTIPGSDLNRLRHARPRSARGSSLRSSLLHERRRLAKAARYTAGVAVGSTGTAAARFDAALFGADFLAEVFLAAGFFFTATGAASRTAAFFAAATTFFAAGFTGFLATLTAFAVLAATLLAAADALAVESAAVFLPTRNASRFFAPAIQPGARPNPDQVFPVFGSTYFATDAFFAFVFFAARLPVTV